jgi:hypothetical protein
MPDPSEPPAGFDPDPIRQRYREERDKRLAVERREILELTGSPGRYLEFVVLATL